LLQRIHIIAFAGSFDEKRHVQADQKLRFKHLTGLAKACDGLTAESAGSVSNLLS
jgi:hypothetical protein